MSAALPPLPPDPTVAVVMPARNAAGAIDQSVRAVLSEPLVSEVAVAVGPSDDGTEDVAAALARHDDRVRVVNNPDGHTPAGLNRAIGATTAEVVVRVDAHSTLPAGYVTRAVDALRESGAANVGGRQVPVGEGPWQTAVAAAMLSPIGSGGARYRSGATPGPVDTVYLGVFRRTALEAVGGFDERFVRNQDAELNERLRRAGYVVWFDPELAVAYAPRSSLTALARQYHQYGRYRRLTARVHEGSLRGRQRAPVVLLIGLGASVLAGAVARNPLPPTVAVGAYASLLLGEGVRVSGPVRAPRIAAALATMHLAWAVGFLQGPPKGAAGEPPPSG